MNSWQAFKNATLKVTKTTVDLALRGLGGVWGWLAGFAFTILWSRVLEPALRYLMRKGHKVVVEKDAKKKAEKLKEADSDKAVDDAIDDLP